MEEEMDEQSSSKERFVQVHSEASYKEVLAGIAYYIAGLMNQDDFKIAGRFILEDTDQYLNNSVCLVEIPIAVLIPKEHLEFIDKAKNDSIIAQSCNDAISDYYKKEV
ncbi:MAG: hypothetical protein NC489_29660 [Ruminococcus flavefaciens]|nr:hypothetical protein [Ruminococcus flavefaciens]